MIPECPRAGDSRSRTRHHHGPVGEPSQDRGGSGGLLSEIRTTINNEPFVDHYTIIPGKELGRGKFAVVRKCVEKCTGNEYAAKFMRKRRKGQDCRMEIIHEIAVLELATASHRVVNLHQVYEMASEMVLVLEFAAGGEIFNQCVSDREEEAFSEEDVKRLMRQILEGVAFLHQNNVVHLDLKPQNILLTSSCPLGDIKIVDFGLSRMISSHQELREIMGTPEYVAPEILNFEPISTATDMWDRATAEQCLQHPWLQSSELQEAQTVEEVLSGEDQDPSSTTSSSTSSPEPPSSTSTAEEEEEDVEEGLVTEELIVMAAYTLGQCRQSSSSTSEKEALAAEQKAISKRFKFEEPFSALQEVPGEFIY
ncbi:serine/threonine-protein kinase 17A isoform X2 [Acanthochromis polyacanthus]|uniref:serine/threonine-protein kinase 17A isoform X2 n=1 Tax=Acanthochromis polyacanthus TaxID=80966 RepID=UPI002233FC7D|nr:serine/threonine-protein kinase 17A isoform X2 [Acanthochromis polyacanthus]